MTATQAQRYRIQTRTGRKHQRWHPVCIHPPTIKWSSFLWEHFMSVLSVWGHYHYVLPVYQPGRSCSWCNLMKWLWKLLVIGLAQALDKSWVLLERAHRRLSEHSCFFGWPKGSGLRDERSAFQSVYCRAKTPSSRHRSILIALLRCVVSTVVVVLVPVLYVSLEVCVC